MNASEKNLEYDTRARAAIAGGALTNSKRPESFVRGVYPTHLKRLNGVKVTDVAGVEYIDYTCALGTNVLGYCDSAVRSAIVNQLGSGISLPLGSALEVEVAEKILGLFPHIERLRFLKTGSEGCSAAVRIARSFTGRDLVISEGYHGWHDEFVSLTPPASGVPAQTDPNMLGFQIQGQQIIVPHAAKKRPLAAIIVEPYLLDASDRRAAVLHELRKLCDVTGACLIFDETITALRVPQLSVARSLGLTPDIAVFGKALAGGMPLSVVGGKARVMAADYFVSSTFAGEMLSLAACGAVLEQVKQPDYIDQLWTAGGLFKNAFNGIAPDLVSIEGYNTRGIFKSANRTTLALFFQEMCKGRVLMGPSWFYALPHRDIDDQVLNLARIVLRRIGHGEIELEGELPQQPFAQRVRG